MADQDYPNLYAEMEASARRTRDAAIAFEHVLGGPEADMVPVNGYPDQPTIAGRVKARLDPLVSTIEAAAASVKRFAGVHPTPPSTRYDGSPLQPGDEYQNSSDNLRYSWSGTSWVALNASVQQLTMLLAGSTGATQIGYGSGTVADALDKTYKVVGTIGELRSQKKTGATRIATIGYATPGDGGGADYYLFAMTGGAANDNGGSDIGATDGGWWKLVPRGSSVAPEQFGASTVGNSTVALQKAIDFAASNRMAVDGRNRTYRVATLMLPSYTWLQYIGFESFGWVGAGTAHSKQPVLFIDGITAPKKEFLFIAMPVNGRRDLYNNIDLGAGEDGGMHGLAVKGDVQKIRGHGCEFYNCGTAGMMLHHPTPSATVTEYKIRDVKFFDTPFHDNREHGWFGDSIDGLDMVRCPSNRNGLDIDSTKPANHGLRGATINHDGQERYFGGGWDLEGYAVGSGIRNVLIDDCDCSGNAVTSGLIYDTTPSNSTGFSPRSNIRVRGGKYDIGLATVVLDNDVRASIKVFGNKVGNVSPYSSIFIEDVALANAPLFNGVSKLEMSGGFVNAAGRVAYVYNSEYWSILTPGLTQKIECLPQPTPITVTRDASVTTGTPAAAMTVTQRLLRCLPSGGYEFYVEGLMTGALSPAGAVGFRLAAPGGYLIEGITISARNGSTYAPVPAHAETLLDSNARVVVGAVSDNVVVAMNVIVNARLG